MQRVESESTLPGVIISQNYQYTEFFLKLYQLGSDLEHGRLRDSAKVLLHLLPCDRQTMRQLQVMCKVPKAAVTVAVTAEKSAKDEEEKLNTTDQPASEVEEVRPTTNNLYMDPLNSHIFNLFLPGELHARADVPAPDACPSALQS